MAAAKFCGNTARRFSDHGEVMQDRRLPDIIRQNPFTIRRPQNRRGVLGRFEDVIKQRSITPHK